MGMIKLSKVCPQKERMNKTKTEFCNLGFRLFETGRKKAKYSKSKNYEADFTG